MYDIKVGLSCSFHFHFHFHAWSTFIPSKWWWWVLLPSFTLLSWLTDPIKNRLLVFFSCFSSLSSQCLVLMMLTPFFQRRVVFLCSSFVCTLRAFEGLLVVDGGRNRPLGHDVLLLSWLLSRVSWHIELCSLVFFYLKFQSKKWVTRGREGIYIVGYYWLGCLTRETCPANHSLHFRSDLFSTSTLTVQFDFMSDSNIRSWFLSSFFSCLSISTPIQSILPHVFWTFLFFSWRESMSGPEELRRF